MVASYNHQYEKLFAGWAASAAMPANTKPHDVCLGVCNHGGVSK